MAAEPVANCEVGAAAAKLEELALHTAVAPPGIVASQAKDELVEFAPGNRSLAARSSPMGGPLAADQLAMPPEQELGAGQERSPGWPRQDGAERGQEESVGGLPAGSTGLSLQHAKLVTECQDLGAEPGVRLASEDQDLEQEADDGVEEGIEHDRGASQSSRIWTRRRPETR
jgi:hypothetical protein